MGTRKQVEHPSSRAAGTPWARAEGSSGCQEGAEQAEPRIAAPCWASQPHQHLPLRPAFLTGLQGPLWPPSNISANNL